MNVPQMPRMWMCMGADYPGWANWAVTAPPFPRRREPKALKNSGALGPRLRGSDEERADVTHQRGKRSRSFNFQNFPVDVRGTASMNS